MMVAICIMLFGWFNFGGSDCFALWQNCSPQGQLTGQAFHPEDKNTNEVLGLSKEDCLAREDALAYLPYDKTCMVEVPPPSELE